MAYAADTLFLPHLSGSLPAPIGRWLFLGARVPDAGLPPELKELLLCEQPHRGPFLQLQSTGVHVEPDVAATEEFEGAFVLIGKHRGENEALIMKASRLCAKGTPLLVAGDKTSGISSLRKRLSQITPIEESMAKNHATVFWLINSDALRGFEANGKPNAPDGYQTAPGMFSHQKIDTGSALLAEYIDSSVHGAVADFGAGWGYLCKEILAKAKPDFLDLYEAHWPSLKAAEDNVGHAPNVQIAYNWLDLTTEQVSRKYDTIVMNPPFHTGRKTEPALGEKFIEVAASALKQKGRLLMVANTNLAYEKALQTSFRSVELLEKRDGFKVLSARK